MSRARSGERTLAVNIGNTSVFAGLFGGKTLVRTRRFAPSDLGRLEGLGGNPLDRVVVCSVVPSRLREVLRLVRRTWNVPAQVLSGESDHGMRILYPHPGDMGADRVAAALGAQELYPKRDVVVVDCGTATTVTALRRDGCVLGGAIFPGLALWPEILARRTALLPRVAVSRPSRAVGRSPSQGIASGCYFGHVGAVREMILRVRREAFGRGRALVVGTGGNAAAAHEEGLFDAFEPALVLVGLRRFADRQAAVGAAT